MRLSRNQRARRVAIGGGAICLIFGSVACLLAAGTAAAHDPIFISEDQTTPDIGPYMPDGTISWALYGSVLDAGDTRGFEFDLRAGDELFISLLIPNLEPEISLKDPELPRIELTAPDGAMTMITPKIREVFEEAFSETSYLTLAELRSPGQAGRYQAVVVGSAPSRFTVAVGEAEVFFTNTERSGDRPESLSEISGPLNAWYSMAPNTEVSTKLDAGEAEIQLHLVEEAMTSGAAAAPEGTLIDSSEIVEPPASPIVDAGTKAGTAVETTPDAPESAPAIETASETATVPAEEPDGSGLNWVAPVGLIGVAVVTAWEFFRRSRSVAP